MNVRKEIKEAKRVLQEVPSLLVTFFVLSIVMMNFLANKSLNTGVEWLALDGGILVSWMCFLTMDIVVKVWGPAQANRLSIIGILVNFVVCAVLYVASLVEGVWGEAYEGGEIVNIALNNTFGGTWYVLLGSTVAFVASAFVNSLLNVTVGKLFRKRGGFIEYATRSYISTMVAQFIDNIVFALIVSVNFFGWSLLQCFTCAATGAIAELLFEIVFSPIGFRIAKRYEIHTKSEPEKIK